MMITRRWSGLTPMINVTNDTVVTKLALKFETPALPFGSRLMNHSSQIPCLMWLLEQVFMRS